MNSSSIFSRSKLLAVLLLGTALTSIPVIAHPGHSADKSAQDSAPGQLVPAKDQDPAWLAKAQAAYPLDSCVVSGDKFDGGEMGQPKDYVYKQPGQPDRLVRFCCNDCVKDFKEDPTKFLKAIDEAAAKKAK